MKRDHHKRETKTCPQCGVTKLMLAESTYCSRGCWAKGRKRADLASERNPKWKGDAAGYRALHTRVERSRGKASTYTCECGRPAQHWANLTGNYTDINDFEAMCTHCHKSYDMEKQP